MEPGRFRVDDVVMVNMPGGRKVMNRRVQGRVGVVVGMRPGPAGLRVFLDLFPDPNHPHCTGLTSGCVVSESDLELWQ